MITNRQAGWMWRRAAPSVVLLLIAIPVALADPQADWLRQEQHACAVILGLNPSVASYDACIRTLDHSLFAAQKGNEAAACAYAGLGSTDRDLDLCAAKLRASLREWSLRDPGD